MGVVCRRFLLRRRHPAVCCSLVRHRADVRSESQKRASVAPFPFPPLSRYRLSLDLQVRWRARLAVSRPVKRAANGRVTDSGFKKKAMKTKNKKSEAAAPASVRPSSVSKTATVAPAGVAPAVAEQRQPRCFRIVRVYHPTVDRRPRTIKNGLTEAEAQAHCSRLDTRKAGVYFDAYEYTKGCKP